MAKIKLNNKPAANKITTARPAPDEVIEETVEEASEATVAETAPEPVAPAAPAPAPVAPAKASIPTAKVANPNEDMVKVMFTRAIDPAPTIGGYSITEKHGVSKITDRMTMLLPKHVVRHLVDKKKCVPMI